MIRRLITDHLLDDLSSERNKVLILYGARQTGKTTLLKELTNQTDLQVLRINADERTYIDLFTSRDLQALKIFTTGYDLLVIDEAQRIPDIGINIKLLHDESPALRIILTGSSSIDLAARTKEAMTGRTWTHKLYPISLEEWKTYNRWNDFELKSNIEPMLLYGMYPEALTIQKVDDKIRYLNELISSYLYKDILAISSIKYPEKIVQLLKLLAYQVGHQVSIQELAKTLQIHREAVINYIDLLEKSFIIFKLPGYSSNLRKEVTKMNKIYFYDTGMRNALINNFEPLAFRNDKGQVWENFVIMELIKYNAYHRNYANLYFWRTYTGAELDLVQERNGQLYGFEIKFNKKKSSAPKTWIETYDNSHFEMITQSNLLQHVISAENK